MRKLSDIEINVVSGGMNEVEIKGQRQSIDAQNGFTLSSISSLPITGEAAARIAGEGLGCAIAVNSVKKKPTLTNASTAATTCSSAFTDTLRSVDWNAWGTAIGNMQSAQSNALSHAAHAQNGK